MFTTRGEATGRAERATAFRLRSVTERRHGQQVASLVQVPANPGPDHVPDKVVPEIVPVAVPPGLAVISVMLTLLPFTVPVK